jgi:hypothetical protein
MFQWVPDQYYLWFNIVQWGDPDFCFFPRYSDGVADSHLSQCRSTDSPLSHQWRRPQRLLLGMRAFWSSNRPKYSIWNNNLPLIACWWRNKGTRLLISKTNGQSLMNHALTYRISFPLTSFSVTCVIIAMLILMDDDSLSRRFHGGVKFEIRVQLHMRQSVRFFLSHPRDFYVWNFSIVNFACNNRWRI